MILAGSTNIRRPVRQVPVRLTRNQLIKRNHVTMTTPLFENNFSGILSALSVEARLPNLKFVPLDILELSAFNAQNVWGHVTLGMASITCLFRKKISGVITRLSVMAITHFVLWSTKVCATCSKRA